MNLELKPLQRRSTFSSKRLAFLAVAGLCLVAGLALRSVSYFDAPEEATNTPPAVSAPPPPVAPTTAAPPAPVAPPPAAEAIEPAPKAAEPVPEALPSPAQEAVTAPKEESEPAGAAAEQGHAASEENPRPEQATAPDSGMILVSRQPIEMLAGPSASATVMYGFPAGRPFRVIGHNGSFVQIQDLKSSASGWIDQAALAPPPRVPTAAAPPQGKPAPTSRKAAADTKPKASNRGGQVTTDSAADQSAPVETQRRPGLFGGGGLFGGIFGNRN